jgi:hypothetical protein
VATSFGKLKRLMESLARLAAPGSAQVEYLQRLGVGDCADELALELHEWVLLLDQLVDDGGVGRECAEEIRAVDRRLDEMSGREHRSLWTRDALQRADFWKEVRQLAATALASLESERLDD